MSNNKRTAPADTKSKDTRGKGYSKGYQNKSGNYKKNRNYSNQSTAYDSDASSVKRAPYDSYKSNDISWWNKSPMYADVTRVPFNRIYGAPFSITHHAANGDNVPVENSSAIPFSGIMNIQFIPTIGSALDANSAVNRAFNSMFGELYSRTTGTPPIQQMDLAMFVTSLSSISCLIGFLKRALGVSQLYSNLNYAYPKQLLRAMGILPTSVIGKQDELRSKINDLILNFNNLKVPDVLDIYVRQYALAHNIYVDEDDVQAQIYLFNPAGYYLYHDINGTDPAYLEWININYPTTGTGTPISTWISAANSALEAWRNSSDLGLITGSISRAFADTATISLDYVLPNETAVPTVDRNIMWQINNLHIAELNSVDPTLDIVQDVVGNYLKFDPTLDNTIKGWMSVGSDNYLLNSFDGNTSDEFIMESTRFIPFKDPNNDLITFNTEIITNVYAWFVTDYGHSIPIWECLKLDQIKLWYSNTSSTEYMTSVLQEGVLSQFKYAPFRYYYVCTSTVADATHPMQLLSVVGDIYKFTTIDSSALAGLEKAATQSVYKLFVAPKYK